MLRTYTAQNTNELKKRLIFFRKLFLCYETDDTCMIDMKKYGYNENELDSAYNVPENAVVVGEQLRKKFIETLIFFFF